MRIGFIGAGIVAQTISQTCTCRGSSGIAEQQPRS
jgi:hypothetical protein